MIYKIENKKIQVMLKNEVIELPIKLKNKINENFKNMKKQGQIYRMENYFVFQKVMKITNIHVFNYFQKLRQK